MKKVFPLKQPGKVDARVVESVKSDVRRYVKRERRKALPAGFTEWNLQCKTGPDAATATHCAVAEISARIDAIANAGGDSIYIEIIASPGVRDAGTPPTA